MIQVLTYSGKENEMQGSGVKINSIHDVESLDSFDLNIIVLQDKKLWMNKRDTKTSINAIEDLKSLSAVLRNSVKAKNVILFPQNDKFYYRTRFNSTNWEECELKNMIGELGIILSCVFDPIKNMNIIYENTKTKIVNRSFPAAFYFDINEKNATTRSEASNKPTTMHVGETILSTLKISQYDELMDFLRGIGLVRDKQDSPKWIEEVKMFDDERQLEIIQENEQLISQHKKNIDDAQEVLNKNQKYKSILYTNGDELVCVVFEILEEILGCNLSEFHDEKKEDFNFIMGDKVFIGEIKGITPNVKKANVSQLDVHVQEYMDDHSDEEVDVVALLIINHQRTKPLKDREAVQSEQIKLAERNGSLIIETITLLKLFEQYLRNEKTREECIDILENTKGILKV